MIRGRWDLLEANFFFYDEPLQLALWRVQNGMNEFGPANGGNSAQPMVSIDVCFCFLRYLPTVAPATGATTCPLKAPVVDGGGGGRMMGGGWWLELLMSEKGLEAVNKKRQIKRKRKIPTP